MVYLEASALVMDVAFIETFVLRARLEKLELLFHGPKVKKMERNATASFGSH